MAITTYWKIQTPDPTTPISTSAWTNLANSIENALPSAGQPVVISAFPGSIANGYKSDLSLEETNSKLPMWNIATTKPNGFAEGEYPTVTSGSIKVPPMWWGFVTFEAEVCPFKTLQTGGAAIGLTHATTNTGISTSMNSIGVSKVATAEFQSAQQSVSCTLYVPSYTTNRYVNAWGRSTSGDGNLIGSNANNLYLSTITGVFFYAGAGY